MVHLRPLCGLVEDQAERPIQGSDKVAALALRNARPACSVAPFDRQRTSLDELLNAWPSM